MKLQGVAIIFIMIAFPMILVLSYYLGMQIDTIKMQTDYDNKLIDATYDSLAAFEINTANEDLSSASDSLRSIINASAATFTNTLGTSLGLSNASKERIREYIPSILFTLYDGYYIYAPTEVPEILEKTMPQAPGSDVMISEGAAIVGEQATGGGYYNNNGGIEPSLPSDVNDYGSLLYEKENGTYSTQIDDDTVMKQDYVLKSYMPYSATYVDGANRATINYTLDNFMSISAQIGNVYYTKSGYYIDENLVTTWSGEPWENMGQDQIKEYCESGKHSISIDIDSINISYNPIPKTDESGTPITDPITGLPIYYTMEELEKKLDVEYNNYQDLVSANPRVDADINASLGRIRVLEESLANLKSITYYLTNTAFSKWVNTLTFIKGSTLINDDGSTYNTGDLTDNSTNIYYDFSGDGQIFIGGNPEEPESVFNNHKYNIIKNAIQYNLNLAMSVYNEKYVSSQDFRMPMLTDNEWEQITQKVSIVSFMQGLPCGTKIYTGYSVVSSTNNELTVIPEEIYYVNADQFNDENSVQYYHRIDCPNAGLGANVISFKSKEVKYDKIYDKHTNLYKYDHKNLACYTCIVQNNYENDSSDIDGDGSNYMSFQDFIENTTDANKRAYYIAVGKERQNLYKTTGYSRNEGIELETPGSTNINISGNRIKAEVTIEVTHPDGIVQDFIVGGSSVGRISTSTKSKQTLEVTSGGPITIPTRASDGASVFQVLSIKYIYK